MIGKITGNNTIQQSQFTETEPPKTEVPKAPRDVVKTEVKFTPAKFAADQRFAGSARESLLRSTLENQIKVDRPQTGGSPTTTVPEPSVGAVNPSTDTAPQISPTVLQPGDNNPEVGYLQGDLNRWRFENGLPQIKESGVYTAETEQAVKDFQKATGLVEDGKAGPNVKTRLALESNADFKQLDPQIKDLIRFDFNQFQNDPAKRDNLVKLATNREFVHLISKESQADALNAFMIHDCGKKENFKNIQDAVLDVAIVEKKGTLAHLPLATQRDVIATMFYKTNPPEDNPSWVRKDIVKLATDPEFAHLSEDQQAKLLEGVRGNSHPNAASSILGILKSPSYKNMDDGMKARVIQLTRENALYEGLYNQNFDALHELSGLRRLMNDESFINLSPNEQSNQLNAFKTVPPGSDLVL